MIRQLKIICILCMMAGTAVAEPLYLSVIYPKEEAVVGAVDSTFIFGSVTPGAALTINSFPVAVHEQGGFIAFIPIVPGTFEFRLVAVREGDTTEMIRTVQVPQPRPSLAYDSLVIINDREADHAPIYTTGERLRVEFQGTPGCRAWFEIPGYADSVPMAERPPQTQAYWGEAVFGGGAVPDSLKIKGYYQGYVDIDYRKLPDSSRVYFYLKTPGVTDIVRMLQYRQPWELDYESLTLLMFDEKMLVDSSRYFVRINPPDYPRLVEFTDSVQIVRVGPRKGYLTIFQPKGVRALAVGRQDGWLKLRLSPTQYGWVHEDGVRVLEPGLAPIRSYLRAIRAESDSSRLTIEFPLSGCHPFRVEENGNREIALYLYGVISDTDWIRYDFDDDNLVLATWSQVDPEMYCLRLRFKRALWGYDVYYDGHILKWQINKPPQSINKLKDKIIIVDPGHSPDPGAIGPTGLIEAEANLNIALRLRDELTQKGARVVMTRDDMSPLPLYDRPEIAKLSGADLFVSIHNNALPDGINPFENNGVSSYYYHPHSIELARSIQTELLKATGLNDHGLYYGNLAVNRPTQYPAVLIECAFMIIPEQEALLKTEKFQKKVAGAVRKGIERFLKDYERD